MPDVVADVARAQAFDRIAATVLIALAATLTLLLAFAPSMLA